MVEPISAVQNQQILLRVSHESSHVSSLQQYNAQAAMASSAQQLVRRTEQELRSPVSVERADAKRTRTATEGGSQGMYAQGGGVGKGSQERKTVEPDGPHLLDVRV